MPQNVIHPIENQLWADSRIKINAEKINECIKFLAQFHYKVVDLENNLIERVEGEIKVRSVDYNRVRKNP
tara:strand:+ start:8655 stop:8864 length:210 start_codon:yes stop_codon:yes gene_type:complete